MKNEIVKNEFNSDTKLEMIFYKTIHKITKTVGILFMATIVLLVSTLTSYFLEFNQTVTNLLSISLITTMSANLGACVSMYIFYKTINAF